MVQYSALRCVSDIWQNNEKPLISNGLRFIVTCLPTAALWVLFHCSRHTFATLQLERDTDIYTIKGMLGHTNVKTTQIYAHIVDKSKRNAADVIHIENLTPTNDDIESVPAI